MDINGGNQTKMFAGSGPKTAAGFLYYGAGGIRKVAIDGGEPVKITEGGGTERLLQNIGRRKIVRLPVRSASRRPRGRDKGHISRNGGSGQGFRR